MENVTEINKKSNIREEMIMKSKKKGGGGGTSKDSRSEYEGIEVLTDEKKKKQLLNAL